MEKSKYSVRIENISLKNFKSIGEGSVYFNEFKKLERKELPENFSNILGLYGQNASGKSSVIDALKIVRDIILGRGLSINILNYIKKGTEAFDISITYLLSNDIKNLLVTYDVKIKQTSLKIFIESESIHFSETIDDSNKFGATRCLFGYTNNTGIKENILSSINSKESKSILNYLAGQRTSIPFPMNPLVPLYPSLTSSLFNKEAIQIIEKDSKCDELIDIVTSLVDFCQHRFLIVTPDLFSGIDSKVVGMNGYDYFENDKRVHKNFPIFFGRQALDEKQYKDFTKMLERSGKVLGALIPGLSIKPHVFNTTHDFTGNKVIEFEIMSVRDGKEIPLFFESRGVKQILSYIGDLAGAFNEEGTFIAIDELDSGVFEYLLGEMVYSFDNFAMGQLLFTSHNFRILEKIKSNEIFFTTVNSENKFIQPKYIKNNNNLRDVYYRLIVQGDDKETYYNRTSSADISSVLSSLGKGNR